MTVRPSRTAGPAGRRATPPNRWPVALLTAVALGATHAPLARAWGNLLLIEAPPAATTFAAGPSLWRLPDYPGATRSRTSLLPGLDYASSSGVFASTDTGVGWNFSQRKSTQAGVRLWPQFGRSASDVQAGLGGIGPRLQVEAFANHAPWEVLLLQSGLLYGAGLHHDGVQMEIGATTGVPIGPDLLGIGVSATYANRAYRQSYYGVTAAQAAASGLPQQAFASGLNDTSLTVSIEHKFDGRWRLSAQWIRVLLSPSIAATPIGVGRRPQVATVSLWRDF